MSKECTHTKVEYHERCDRCGAEEGICEKCGVWVDENKEEI